MHDATSRFSDRVANYVKYRPDYPVGVLRWLEEEGALAPGDIVADIGSGTGMLSQLLLDNGYTVYGVEPNEAMRHAAEERLSASPQFFSVDGSAEHSGLDEHSIDLIVAGQAFHWFDQRAARTEFKRMLKPGKACALIWNERQVDASPFLAGYENLLHRYGRDYAEVNHAQIGENIIRQFFAGGSLHTTCMPHQQLFDFEGIKGRLLSSSYAPNMGEPGCNEMLAALEELYRQHATNDQIVFAYSTQVFLGVWDPR